MSPSDGRTPVTVLAGTSTSLREQVAVQALRERPGACAVVYDLDTALGGVVLVRRVLDARGEHDREPVELVGCCLACTVRADVAPALDLVTAAGRWREVVVCLPAPVTPAAVADALRDHAAARPDTVAVVVDAVLLASQVAGDDLLADRGLQAAPTDRRSTAELLVGLVEEADVLLVTGLHRLHEGAAAHAQALLAHHGPLAVQVPVAPDGRGASAAVGTGRSAERAGAQERERLAALAAAVCPPRCGVTTVVWSADGALHAGRLRDALEDLVRGVVRSRGHISLAGRPGRRLRWESAGDGLSFGDPVPVDGPPRCDLVLVGSGLDAAALVQRLDACLADPQEEPGPDDPFRDALGPADVVEHP